MTGIPGGQLTCGGSRTAAGSGASVHFLLNKHPLDSGPEKHREPRWEHPATSGDPPGREGSQAGKQLPEFSAIEEVAV